MAAQPMGSTLQDLVYNVDVGGGLRIIKVFLYILFILALMLIYTVTQFKGLDNAEAMDQAQIGRNLAQKKGFTTDYIRPLSLWCLKEKSPAQAPRIDQHPDIFHAPLYPLLLAAGYKATGVDFKPLMEPGVYPPEQWVVIPMNHLFTLLSGVLVFFLGRRLFDSRVAWLGMTLFFLSNTVWDDSISGTGVAVVTFWALLAFYAAVVMAGRDQDGAPARKLALPFLAAALACLLAGLTRYGALAITPAIALYVGLAVRRRGWIWAVALLLIVVAGMTPWLVRNKQVSGGILGLATYTALADTSLFADDTLERTLAPKLAMDEVPQALQVKWLRNLALFYQDNLRTLGDGLLTSLFLVTFFYRFVRRPVQIFRWCLLLGLVLMMMVAALFGVPTARLLHLFWPVVILYGLAFFFLLLDRLEIKVRLLSAGVITALGVACALPLVFTLLPPRKSIPYPPYFPPFITHVCSLLNARETICADMPWATAWYGQRSSLQLPVTVNEFYEINDYIKKISGLYFTTISRDKPYVSSLINGSYKAWFPIWEGRVPADFPLTHGFPIGEMNQLFLTDRARWLEKGAAGK